MKLNNKRQVILLILYGMIVYLAVWALAAKGSDVHELPIALWAAIGAVGACGAMLEILMHLRVRRGLNQIKDQICKMSQTSEVGLVMIDEQWSVEGMPGILNQYLTMIRDRMNELKRDRKELNLLVCAMDAEKFNTEAIVRNISDVVIVVNAFGDVTLANAQAQELFGFTLSDQEDTPVEKIISDPRLLEWFDFKRWQKAESCRFDYKFINGDTVRYFAVTVSPIYVRDHEVWALAMTLHDVTHERELNSLKNDFVNHVSHELRTPLSSIKAYVELLLDGDMQTPEGRHDFYRIIEAETDRLDRFIGNVLDLGRIESGMMAVNFDQVDLNEEMRKAVELVRFVAEEKRISLSVQLCEMPIVITADRDLIRQVMLNLLSNAIKYTPAGGSVVAVLARDSEHQCSFCVTDSGIGISEVDQGRIFDRFYRCSSSSTGGTGLGLTLVKKVVEEIHHGFVFVKSDIDSGSTFSIFLPINPKGSDSSDVDELEVQESLV